MAACGGGGGSDTPSGGGSAPEASSFRLPIVTASILHANGRRGVLSIETGLDVPDATLRTRAEQSAPRLRAAFNTVAQRFVGGLRPGMPPDIGQLASAAQTAGNTAL